MFSKSNIISLLKLSDNLNANNEESVPYISSTCIYLTSLALDLDTFKIIDMAHILNVVLI